LQSHGCKVPYQWPANHIIIFLFKINKQTTHTTTSNIKQVSYYGNTVSHTSVGIRWINDNVTPSGSILNLIEKVTMYTTIPEMEEIQEWFQRWTSV